MPKNNKPDVVKNDVTWAARGKRFGIEAEIRAQIQQRIASEASSEFEGAAGADKNHMQLVTAQEKLAKLNKVSGLIQKSLRRLFDNSYTKGSA
ncbi:MAG: hypothetical protein ACI9WC_000954 [Arenicella sp.]|jgi:hypothetical protein